VLERVAARRIGELREHRLVVGGGGRTRRRGWLDVNVRQLALRLELTIPNKP
jgi:adenylosuccinate synthase